MNEPYMTDDWQCDRCGKKFRASRPCEQSHKFCSRKCYRDYLKWLRSVQGGKLGSDTASDTPAFFALSPLRVWIPEE